MQNLIITIIAISLFAIAATWGINHVDIEATKIANKVEVMKSDISKISFIVAKYRIYEEDNPRNFDDLVSAGYMKKLVREDGKIEFLPGFTEPYFEWPETNQLKYDNGSFFVCFQGDSVNEEGKSILDRFNTISKKKLSEDGTTYEIYKENNNSVVISDMCFDSDDKEIQPDENGFYQIKVTVKQTGDQ